jgi:hypothetical protein
MRHFEPKNLFAAVVAAAKAPAERLLDEGATAPIRSRICMLGRAMQMARLPSLKVSLRSISTDRTPYRASAKAAVMPIGPAPTITTGCRTDVPSSSGTARAGNSGYLK